MFQCLLAQMVARGSAIEMATTLEIDAVIDPAHTRGWLAQGLAGARIGKSRKRGAEIDPW